MNEKLLQYEWAFSDACFVIAHWVFGIQYLRTSFVLPVLFQRAKIEWLMTDTYDVQETSIDSKRSGERKSLLR